MQQKTDYRSEAIGRLLASLQDKANLNALVSAFLDRCQELEDAAFPLYTQRNIDSAEGDRLDGLGELTNVPRAGRNDDDYRLRIKAELAILLSQGTAYDLLRVYQLLISQTPLDMDFDEYYPKTVFIRPRDFDSTDFDLETIATLVRRAAPAGTNVQVLASFEASDDNVFKYGATGSESSSSNGFGNGTYTGAF